MSEYTPGQYVKLLLEWIEVAALSLELLAVAIIVIVALTSTVVYLRGFFSGGERTTIYERYRVGLGRGLLLGLEVLVAADIILTVALKPTLASVASLAILVLIRTFLGWSIVVEIEHRWPWQHPAHAPDLPASRHEEHS